MARSYAVGPGFTKIKGYVFKTDAGVELDLQWHVNTETSEFAVTCKKLGKIWKLPGASVEKIDAAARKELRTYAEGDWKPYINFELQVKRKSRQKGSAPGWSDDYRESQLGLDTNKREFNLELGKSRGEPVPENYPFRNPREVRDEQPDELKLNVSWLGDDVMELGGDLPESPILLAGIGALQRAIENLGILLLELGQDAPDSMGSNYQRLARDLEKFTTKQRANFQVPEGAVEKAIEAHYKRTGRRRRS